MRTIRRRGKRFASLLILQGFMLILAACERPPKLEVEILGKWMFAQNEPKAAMYYEFFKDGTVVIEVVRDKKQYFVGTYSFLDSTRIKMRISDAGPLGGLGLSGPTKVLSIFISGNETTLVDPDGATLKLKRVNSK